MRLHTIAEGDILTVSVEEGRLDAAISTAFKDQMRKTLAESAGGTVVLDLSQVDFMDSSGLGALIAVLKSMPANRRLELRCLRPNLERVMRLTRMDSVFTIHPCPDRKVGTA